jgi:hypothetical protein
VFRKIGEVNGKIRKIVEENCYVVESCVKRNREYKKVPKVVKGCV